MKRTLQIRSAFVLASLASVLVLTGFSCSKGPAWKDHTFAKRQIAGGGMDVQLPMSLWKKMEELLTGGHEAGAGGGHGEAGGEGASEASSMKSLPTEFAPLKVYLIEKNRGILRRANHEIEFGPGGGEIDLNDFVAPLNGSFYFVAEFLPEVITESRKVYFVSNAVARKVDGERIGAGCNSYFDITKAMQSSLQTEGFLVNTQANRHVSALAGTYFFAVVHEAKLHLASLTIRDSGHRNYLCKRR